MQLKILTNRLLEDVYSKFVVKPASYFAKFSDIAGAFTTEELASYGKMDPPRLVSLVDFKEWIRKYNISQGGCLLSTCANDPELQYLSYANTTVAPYPPYDLHTLDLTKKDYDFVVFNQTIEHLHTPILAINRVWNHLKPGGHLYTTVPTVNIPHMTPIHFNGYTPVGLCALMISCGFEICECGYWGNNKYMDYIFTHGEWPTYVDVLDGLGRLTYDAICQAQTWVLVRKV